MNTVCVQAPPIMGHTGPPVHPSEPLDPRLACLAPHATIEGLRRRALRRLVRQFRRIERRILGYRPGTPNPTVADPLVTPARAEAALRALLRAHQPGAILSSSDVGRTLSITTNAGSKIRRYLLRRNRWPYRFCEQGAEGGAP